MNVQWKIMLKIIQIINLILDKFQEVTNVTVLLINEKMII